MTTQRRASVPFADRMGHVTEFLLIGYLPLEEGRRVSPFLPLPPGTWRWIWKGGVENREDEDILQRWYSHRLSPGSLETQWIALLQLLQAGEANGKPTPVFLPGEFHGQRRLVGYSPWGRRESDTTERLILTLTGERNETILCQTLLFWAHGISSWRSAHSFCERPCFTC